MYNKTVEVVKETNLPFFIIDETKQQGDSFGERFCNALEYCFSKGYNNLITIGGDCAVLHAKDILEAGRQLQNGFSAIGADSHGGFYLLALQKINYNRNIFLNFNWCSKHLFKNITSHFKNTLQAPIYLLTSKQDINTAVNLKDVINLFSANGFVKLVSRIFKSIYDLILSITYLLQHIFSNGFALRGPPAVAAF